MVEREINRHYTQWRILATIIVTDFISIISIATEVAVILIASLAFDSTRYRLNYNCGWALRDNGGGSTDRGRCSYGGRCSLCGDPHELGWVTGLTYLASMARHALPPPFGIHG